MPISAMPSAVSAVRRCSHTTLAVSRYEGSELAKPDRMTMRKILWSKDDRNNSVPTSTVRIFRARLAALTE